MEERDTLILFSLEDIGTYVCSKLGGYEVLINRLIKTPQETVHFSFEGMELEPLKIGQLGNFC